MNCINFVVPMNPCKCGYYPDRSKCSCREFEIARYLGRVSKPLLDRIDICVEAPVLRYDELVRKECGEPSAVIQQRVIAALERQKHRFLGTQIASNSRIPSRETDRYCKLTKSQQSYMKQIYQSMRLSARGYYKILKTARTIADLDGSEQIQTHHLNEAVCYRVQDEKYWE